MKFILIITLVFLTSSVFSTPGDIIDVFTIEGQSIYGISGLAKDWDDGHVFACGVRSPNKCEYCKFATGDHSLIRDWQTLAQVHQCYDMGYPYVYNGIKTFVVADFDEPRLKIVNAETGGFLSYIIDPFVGIHNVGIGVNPANSYVFCTNEGYNECKVWNKSSWSSFASYDEGGNMGVAFGWEHVFIVFNDPVYKIKVFNINGEFVDEYLLSNWGTGYVKGLSCARENIVGGNESLYISIYYPNKVIKEVEIGNFSDVAVENLSLGQVKALFH